MGGGLLHFLQVALGFPLFFGAVALGLRLNPASLFGLLWLRGALLLAAGFGLQGTRKANTSTITSILSAIDVQVQLNELRHGTKTARPERARKSPR